MSESEKVENILRFSVTQNQKSSFVTTQVQMPTTHLQWGHRALLLDSNSKISFIPLPFPQPLLV